MRILLIPDLYESPDQWQAVIDAFATFDLPADVFTYEPPRTSDLSNIVADVTQHLIDETYVIGYGLGGRIAIQLASQNPHHLAGSMLISTPAVPAPGFAAFLYKIWRVVTTPIRILIPFYFRKKFVTSIKKLRPGDPKKSVYRELTAPPMDSFFLKITDPVLILWGARDSKTKPKIAERISEIMHEMDVKHDVQFVANGQAALHRTHPLVVVSAAISVLKSKSV